MLGFIVTGEQKQPPGVKHFKINQVLISFVQKINQCCAIVIFLDENNQRKASINVFTETTKG